MSKTRKKVSVTEFKAHALQIIEGVRTNKKEVEIYKRGKLVAKLCPAEDQPVRWLGALDGTVVTCGDPDSILEPLDVKWDANEE